MRKCFVIWGFAASMIAASSVARAGTGEGSTSRGGGTSSSGKVPTFTLDQAILTALQRNPTLLNAEQEIKRTKGVIIQVRAQVLPQINVNATYDWTDPNLVNARTVSTTAGTTGTTPTGTGASGSLVESPQSQVGDARTFAAAAPTATPGVKNTQLTDISYSISVIGTQLIFNGTSYNQIRGTF